MGVSRRQFFKGLGAAIGMVGLSSFLKAGTTHASEKTPVGEGKVGIEWLGHGTFLFTSCEGKKILLDPWISTNPKCPSKYRNMAGFGALDMILWTHAHADHFMLRDAEQLVTAYQPKIVAPYELSYFIKREIPAAECRIYPLANKGATAHIDGIKLSMVEAFHSSSAKKTGVKLRIDEFVGEAVGYIIEFENGLRIYHSGDTSLMGDMKSIIADFYNPHIAILPIGGVFTMGPAEAAFACKLIRPAAVIPEHYGTFPGLVQTTDVFKEEVRKQAPKTKVIDMKPGDSVNM